MEVIKRVYKSSPMLVLFIGLILFPAVILFFNGYSYLLNTQPEKSGNLSVNGIQASVKIETDTQGITHINAQYDNDAFFAMGVVHAQDRLWQLELQRRMATGTLAEIFGKNAVGFDIYIRTLDISGDAEKAWDELSQAGKSSLLAYTRGINSYLDDAQDLPTEFTILGIDPKRWKPVHSLALFKLFGLGLAGDFQKDIQRLVISRSLRADKAKALIGAKAYTEATRVTDTDPAVVENLARMTQLSIDVEEKWGLGGKSIGSNAWVISGEHTLNGKAVLANDPHLSMELPSQWYAVSLKGDKLNVAGMSLVGLPLVMLGKNNNIAWGSTNMLADTMDLYYEKINVANDNQYLRGDKWIDFKTRIETIKVKADFPSILREELKPLKIKIRMTEQGPIISDVVNVFKQPVSLRWSGSEASDTSFDAFYQLNYATDWHSFNQAMDLLVSPVMNMFYLDNQQNIGQLGAGKVPIRGKGNGSVPVPGWDLAYAWKGFIPQEQMPQSYNPDNGYLVSANNQVFSHGGEYFISQDWADSQRAERIEHLIKIKLDKSEKITIADHKSMQMDMFDLQALVVLPTLIKLKTDDENVNTMLNILKKWDGSTSEDNVGTTIFFTLMRHLQQQLFNDEFENYWGGEGLKSIQRGFVNDISMLKINDALNSQTPDWCDRMDTHEKESCDDIQLLALQATYEELEALLGDDIEEWEWGKIHKTVYVHRPFSEINGLDLVFERDIAKGGSPNSINMSEFSFKAGQGYTQNVGATLRQIMQFSDNADNTQDYLFTNSTGQSGNVVSAHYDDSIEAFVKGQYFSLFPMQDKTMKTLNLVVSKTAN